MRFFSAVRVGILLCGAAVPLVSFGQFQPPSKEELALTSVPKAPDAPAVFLYREEISQDATHHTTVYARIKILSTAGLDAATVHIRYHRNFVFSASGDNSSHMSSGTATSWSLPDFSRQGEDQPWNAESYDVRGEVAALEGRTIHPDGAIIPLTGKTSDILKIKKDPHSPEDMYFTMPGVTVGSILEYRYQIRYDRFDLAPEWQVQRRYFAEKEHFAYTPAVQFMPERNRDLGGSGTSDAAVLDVHGQAMTDLRYAEALPAGKAVSRQASGAYVLDLTDVPAFPAVPFAPPEQGLSYAVRFFYTPTVVPADFWNKEMGYWMKSLDKYTDPTPALRSAVSEACSPSDAPLVKAKKLYALVQTVDNTDFNATGAPPSGSESFPFTKVEKVLLDKKGASNQIAYLYYALAKIAGLHPQPERIASRSMRIFNPNLLVTDQLDTVLIALNIDGKKIILDPGTRFAPFETLHWAHTGAGGVTLADNGKVEDITTPVQKNTDNSTLHVGTLTITPQGGVSGLLKIAFLGQPAIELRQLSVTSGYEGLKDSIDKMLASEVPPGITAKVDHVAFVDDTSKQLLAVVPVSGSLASPGNGRISLPRFFFESQENNPFPADGDRTLPVDMRYPAQDQEQITYQLPAGFTIDNKPADATLRFGENAAYEARTKVASGSVTNARVLARGFIFLAPKDYVQLHDFYQKVVATDQQPLVLGGSQANKGQ